LALWSEVTAMQVGDCLSWDTPAGVTRRAMSSALSYFLTCHQSSVFHVRLLFHGPRMFIVRLA